MAKLIDKIQSNRIWFLHHKKMIWYIMYRHWIKVVAQNANASQKESKRKSLNHVPYLQWLFICESLLVSGQIPKSGCSETSVTFFDARQFVDLFDCLLNVFFDCFDALMVLSLALKPKNNKGAWISVSSFQLVPQKANQMVWFATYISFQQFNVAFIESCKYRTEQKVIPIETHRTRTMKRITNIWFLLLSRPL